MKLISNTHKLILVAALIAMTSIFSCTDDLDINTDPLAAEVIDPALLFPQFLVQMSSNRTVELNAVNIHGAQHWTSGGSAGVFSNPEIYTISPFSSGNFFTSQFTGVLRNLSLVQTLVETNSPDDLNIIGQVKIMEAFTYLNASQVFEDIPFEQATNVAEFPNPEYNTQEEVLRGLLTRVDEGIELLSTSTDIVTTADLLYGGDREGWIRFGNSIKLKALMLIANVDPASVSTELQALSSEPLITDNSWNAELNFTADVGNENPLWGVLDAFAGGNNPFWFAGSTLVNVMNENDDPRRATYFDEEDGGIYVGQDQGNLDPTGISNISLNILRPDLEDRYITAAEVNYFLAEAILKGIITGDADAFYRAGLESSLNSYDGQPGEISGVDKTAYLNSRGTIRGLSAAEAIEQVNTEQYVALFTRGIEAWTHWRRTKTPDFQLPQNAQLDDILRRYNYPTDETASNPNTPANSPLDSPMWFEGN